MEHVSAEVQSRLTWSDLETDVSLGWTKDERATKQKIRLHGAVGFPRPPRATKTDELGDTVCYDVLTRAALDVTEGEEFKLIEHLAARVHDALETKLPDGASIWIKIEKLDVPISELKGSATFSIGDPSLRD